ncbi:hypothetical protein FA09DRAFT_135625 [Tilletiopsis washingtonensis]|uniref:Uncharacterized protein n=1 Tax=Tilletiopsis washingtonensis TaxID=58919 RepID=A0A316Z608_9BASI|nr:hypothetical protein FA09DRAFT_135625 [Tilletiopsis washingtonensis]PWN95645.1 hypothetical protein FA09DRAFT_135625 [Tilletiopsis washingtonensis]
MRGAGRTLDAGWRRSIVELPLRAPAVGEAISAAVRRSGLEAGAQLAAECRWREGAKGGGARWKKEGSSLSGHRSCTRP